MFQTMAQNSTTSPRHVMFCSKHAVQDPDQIAKGKEFHPPADSNQPHDHYFSTAHYWTPHPFNLQPGETVIVHFNPPPSARWLGPDNQLTSPVGDSLMTMTLTHTGTDGMVVPQNTVLQRLTENSVIQSNFTLTSLVYRHQLVYDHFFKEGTDHVAAPPPIPNLIAVRKRKWELSSDGPHDDDDDNDEVD